MFGSTVFDSAECERYIQDTRDDRRLAQVQLPQQYLWFYLFNNTPAGERGHAIDDADRPVPYALLRNTVTGEPLLLLGECTCEADCFEVADVVTLADRAAFAGLELLERRERRMLEILTGKSFNPLQK